MNEYSKEEYRGHTIVVCYDECPEDPRKWCSQLSRLVIGYRGYNLGDEHDVERAATALYEKYVGEPDDDMTVPAMLQRVQDTGMVAVCPIIVYKHSGIALSLGTEWRRPGGWDYSLAGFAYVECSTAEANCSHAQMQDWQAWALEVMQVELEEYNHYIEGEVYGFRVLDEDGEETDSCWGFYDKEFAVSEAKDSIDYDVQHHAEERKYNELVVSSNLHLLQHRVFASPDGLYQVQHGDILCAQIENCLAGDFLPVAIDNVPDQVLAAMADLTQEKDKGQAA